MSGPKSIQRAISEAHPDVRLVKDILSPAPAPKRRTASSIIGMVSQVAEMAKIVAGSTDRKICVNKNAQLKYGFVAFTSVMQVLFMQRAYGYTSVHLSPEPKNQREARKR